ncbi:hypothetical protein FI667_g10969, partial [Globisporangium splendens]
MNPAPLAIVLGLLATASLTTASNTTSTTDSIPDDTIEAGRFRGITVKCSAMSDTNWDSIKYACSWNQFNYDNYYNLFFKGYDGRMYQECHCRGNMVGTYGEWAPRWTRSKDGAVECFTRDGRQAWDAKNEFNSAPNCPPIPVRWIGDDPTRPRNP